MDTLYPAINRSRIIAGIFSLLMLLLIISFVGSEPVLRLFHLTSINATLLFISRLLYWLCAFLLWLYAHKAEGQDLLIWKDVSYPFSTYLISIIVILLVLFGGSVLISLLLKLINLNQTSTHMQEMAAIFRENEVLLVFTSFTAGVTEELLFRGYLQTRFEKLFSKSYVSILLSSLLFGLLHFRYGTVANILIPFFIGLVFSFYYWKCRNIKVIMICHFVWDLIISILLVTAHH